MPLGSWFLLGIAGVIRLSAVEPELSFTVLVYNFAGMPGETVARAEWRRPGPSRGRAFRSSWLIVQPLRLVQAGTLSAPCPEDRSFWR